MGITRDQTMTCIVGASHATDMDADALMAPIYNELRAMAAGIMRGDRANTLQPTALVNEAYIKLAGDREWESPAHFIAVAAKAMRQVLIDHARAKQAAKRGGGHQRIDLSEVAHDDDCTSLFILDEALRRLEEHDSRASNVVELKFFGGLTNDEVAMVLGISRTTVAADWRHARAWLRIELDSGSGH